ncbi:TPA: SDR family oxidoreductase [Legionella pneumophila]|nr:SDR family oxidoreductase [Legionella pneumophila]
MMTLITGATRGIGLALAYEFASHGHDLILIGRDSEQLEHISKQLNTQYQVNVEYKVHDLSKPGSAFKLYTDLKEQGVEVNCLVNNAGIGYMGSFVEMGMNKLDDLMNINMISLSELTLCFLDDFVARNEGSILQVSSTAAFQPGPFMAAYYASKAYVATLSHAIAYELKDTKVSMSILCPGATKTNFFHASGMESSMLERGYIGMMTPEKVAKIAYKGLKKGKLYIIPGLRNKILAYAAAISPKAIALRIASYLHHKIL